jgi:hypothetical protein
MLRRSLPVALGLAGTICSWTADADYLRLAFDVDVDRHWVGAGAVPSDPNIGFEYSVLVGLDPTQASSATFLDGSGQRAAWFPASIIPESMFTDDVRDKLTLPVDLLFITTSVARQYPVQFGGDVITLESLFFTTYGYSPIVSPPDNIFDLYERGVSGGNSLPGDALVAFTADSFVLYMQSLIGKSDFWFRDIWMQSQYLPDENRSVLLDQYGYGGSAKLIEAIRIGHVLEPSTLALLIVPLLLLVSISTYPTTRTTIVEVVRNEW